MMLGTLTINAFEFGLILQKIFSFFSNDSSFIIEISHMKHKILPHFSLIFRNCSVPSQWTVATE